MGDPSLTPPRSPFRLVRKQAKACILSHVWPSGLPGVRASGTQHGKKILCHVNLCKAPAEVAPGLPGKSLGRLPRISQLASSVGTPLLPCHLGCLRLEHPKPRALLPPVAWPWGTALRFTFRERLAVPLRQGLTPQRWTEGHREGLPFFLEENTLKLTS